VILAALQIRPCGTVFARTPKFPAHAEETIMATKQQSDLVVGVFEHQADAEQAVAALWRVGFPRDHIDMATRSQGVTKATTDLTEQKTAADGALTGAIAGASVGLLAGTAATVLIPGLGTILGGSLLAGAIGGAALGAAGGTFLGPFVALQMPEDEAHHYARHAELGRTIVLVQTRDRAAEARAILRSHGADERHDFRAAAATL
jgi:hypothetical protein